MKRIISLAVCLLLLAGCGATTAEPGISTIDWEDHDERVEQLVIALVNGDFTIVAEGFDAQLQKALSVRRLGSAWKGMLRRAGTFIAIVGTELEPHDEYVIYNVLTRHQSSGLNVRIVFSDDGLVAGLFFSFITNPEAVF